MQVSRYNKFFRVHDGAWLVYNCLTNGLAKLTEKKYHQVRKILAAPDRFPFNTAARRALREKLIRGGFLVPKQIDEMHILKTRNRSARFDSSRFGLAILPTLRCNFRCTYCYQARKNITMNKKTQDDVIALVRDKTRHVKVFTTHWCGGEPLLALDTIVYLSHEFKKVCAENGCSYNPGGIVTNGYLLTKSVAERLKTLGIETCQITLDGPRDIHDQRRPLANGTGTFDRIIDNLCQVSDSFKTISLRINTDKNNAHHVISVLKTIEKHGLKDRVRVYFAQVMAHTQACANISGSCLKDQEYSRWVVRLTKQGCAMGFSLAKYPHVKFVYCEADRINSFVVGPDGSLYKCWSEQVNPAEAVGHVNETMNDQTHKRNLGKWLAWDVFEKLECCDCDILPICMGGCPYVGMKMKSKTKGACEEWRHNLIAMLKLYYINHAQKSQKKEMLPGKEQHGD